MALFDKQLELVTEGDLLSLVENQEREGYQIEYKQAVAFQNELDKREFLAAVTSFANSIGGDLVIGMTAKGGLPDGVPGWEGVDVDQEKLRIENLLRDGVEPRISFKVRELRLRTGNSVILLRIPWSWAQPHMVRIGQVNRFYYRHSAGKDIMNVSQLRAAFALSASLDQQIENFRHERTESIRSGFGSHLGPLAGPTTVIHVVPFESFRSGFHLNPETSMEQLKGCMLPLGTGSNRHGFNLDGIYCVDEVGRCNAYTQVFRNGIIEGASRKFLFENEGRRFIASGSLTRAVLQYVQSTMDFYRRLNVPPPAAIMMTVLHICDCQFATPFNGCGYVPHAFDRDQLVLPGTLVQDFSQSPADICRPIFDALWNAAGLAKWTEAGIG